MFWAIPKKIFYEHLDKMIFISYFCMEVEMSIVDSHENEKLKHLWNPGLILINPKNPGLF